MFFCHIAEFTHEKKIYSVNLYPVPPGHFTVCSVTLLKAAHADNVIDYVWILKLFVKK